MQKISQVIIENHVSYGVVINKADKFIGDSPMGNSKMNELKNTKTANYLYNLLKIKKNKRKKKKEDR